MLLLSLLLLPLPMLTLGAEELMLVDLATAEGQFLQTGVASLVYFDECWGCLNLLQTQKRAECQAGFFGGRMLLGPDPSCQLLVFAALQHFFIKVRKPAFLSAGILSLVTWLMTLAQLS